MSEGTVSAKTKNEAGDVVTKTVQYVVPTTLDELTEKFGSEAVASAAHAQITIGLQAFIRSNINKSDEEVQAAVDAWKPGTRTSGPKKSPLEKALGALAGMSAEDKAALLQRLSAN